MNFLPGVKKTDRSKAFYYDERDVNMISVPICQCEGDYILSPDELRRYFGVEPSRMGKLPEYLIVPRLNSTWNAERSKSTSKWWDITGEVVAYKPLEWVPIVREKSIPYNHFEAEYQNKTTTIQTSEIYGRFEPSFTMSIGSSWKSIKTEISTTTEKLTMGMCLRVKRVYEHSIHLFLNDEETGSSLTWYGPESWSELHIASNAALRDVEALQFHPINMTGGGHSHSLFLQALPVFDAEKKLTDLHLILSCKGWSDWYVYNSGTRTTDSGRVETLPMPDNKKPLVTFVAAGV
ncbi:hypothetical protein BGZ65_004495 [Modicella reniformis]|uniref:Uncharacterized protein n=1 Tax=Modicella reniformis TaxID=1440133 RepID=A0A9P6M8W6_9FUNG|nr:hypothetical protein BGZ65_004495 [Modicella reniformis]